MKREYKNQSQEHDFDALLARVKFILQQPQENHEEIAVLLDKIKSAIQEIGLKKSTSEAA